MSKQIQKSLQGCISKFKILNKQLLFPACRHIRTASFSEEEQGNDAATLEDIDRFLFENFRSLFQMEIEGERMTKENEAKPSTETAYLFDSSTIQNPPPLANLRGNERFFVASGSSSSRIVDEETSSSSTMTDELATPSGKADTDAADGEVIVLLMQSRSPCEEFRRSMEEIVEAHLERNGKVDWEYLEELLNCYLEMNNKSSHKYVVQAFVDLVAALRAKGRSPAITQPLNGGATR